MDKKPALPVETLGDEDLAVVVGGGCGGGYGYSTGCGGSLGYTGCGDVDDYACGSAYLGCGPSVEEVFRPRVFFRPEVDFGGCYQYSGCYSDCGI